MGGGGGGGGPSAPSGFSSGGPGFSYTWSGDPNETFRMFFGNSNPFSFFGEEMDEDGGGAGGPGGMPGFGGAGGFPGMFRFANGHGGGQSMHQQMGGGQAGSAGGGGKKKLQDPPIYHDLLVSLDDIANGTTKKMKISRRVLAPDGRNTHLEDKVLTIDIKPGWKAGTKITFPREGDQSPNAIPADIVFIIRDKPNALFKRDGSDLIYTARVSLREALLGATIQVPTLDGRKKQIQLSEPISPSAEKRIAGEGLPYPKQTSKKGDIIVRFDIKFPDTLTPGQRDMLSQCLPR